MLKEKILSRQSGIMTYGITPPKAHNTEEKILEITQRHISRLNQLEIDALILYDIQDEAERTEKERTFEFLPTIDSATYSEQYLNEIKVPKIIYRWVGKYSRDQFKEWLLSKDEVRYSVFVGAASSSQETKLKLSEAYKLNQEVNSNLILGGVIIPERHAKKNDEHIRVVGKMENNCKFFISQAVYNVEAAKNFLSEYHYYCEQTGIVKVPILFTLTPCGSQKTLEFMKWLGISIPKWLQNDLINTHDILDKSIQILKSQFDELLDFAKDKKIPIGCNVESVSVKRAEIEASIDLAKEIHGMMRERI